MRILFLSVLAFLALPFSGHSQSLKQVLEAGDESFQNRDYFNAYRCYETILSYAAKGAYKEDTLKVHDLEVIRDEYIVRRGEEKISLPRKEFELLYFLASYPGKVFRRAKLLEQVWGDVFVVDRTIDVHIRKLREKIGDDYIQTVKGVGYKLKKEE